MEERPRRHRDPLRQRMRGESEGERTCLAEASAKAEAGANLHLPPQNLIAIPEQFHGHRQGQ
jgi:hypothetical protein